MSVDKLPARLNWKHLGDETEALHAVIPVNHFPRLGHEIYGQDAGKERIDITLFARKTTDGQRWLVVKLDVDVGLQCQRCMQGMLQHLQIETDLLVVKNEAQAVALGQDENYVVAEEGWFQPQSVIEDEVLLALPAFPKHADKVDCGSEYGDPQTDAPHNEHSGNGEGEADRPNPFAVLEQLKRN